MRPKGLSPGARGSPPSAWFVDETGEQEEWVFVRAVPKRGQSAQHLHASVPAPAKGGHKEAWFWGGKRVGVLREL